MEQGKQLIIANHYFSGVSAEIQGLFQNRYYYGCISLCQSSAEAYARFLYERWTNDTPTYKFLANIHKLEGKTVQPAVGELLKKIFGEDHERDCFHHLRNDIPTEYETLKAMATEKVSLLNTVESQVFEYRFNDNGGITPKYGIYWETDNPKNTYLRLD